VHALPALIGRATFALESETLRAGIGLARALSPGDIVFLEGELGAGKSTLARAVLRALGWNGPVRSPSYALVHTYRMGALVAHHLDLYRVASLDEALGLDLDRIFSPEAICLVEWPDRLDGTVRPDWVVRLEIEGDGRNIELRGPSRPGQEAILAPPNQENDP
jgi:tRNA threonylcarbamoyladenosine biosynthesis protein TsaE